MTQYTADGWQRDVRLEAAERIGGLAIAILRSAYLFKGYGDGPLQVNAKTIKAILDDWAALAREEKDNG